MVISIPFALLAFGVSKRALNFDFYMSREDSSSELNEGEYFVFIVKDFHNARGVFCIEGML